MKSFLFFIIFVGFYLNIFCQLNPEVIQIEMRDGKNLTADLYLPSLDTTYPVILIQTPYNRKNHRGRLPLQIESNIESSPYAVVIVDWRCFYDSAIACGGNSTRGEDGYDAVEWIAAQSWCNGKIATWGPSALGNVQYQTAKENPPSLVCAVPLVASPQIYYEKYYPGGIAEQAYLETLSFLFGPGINIYSQNPYENFLWTAVENSSKYYSEINVPMLNIAGWFDHNIEDCIENFNGLKELSTIGDEHKLLIGPWVHGGVGFAAPGTTAQGELFFPEADGYPDMIARQFLDYHLLNENNGWQSSASIQYFQMGDNKWDTSDEWPISNLKTQSYFLSSNHELSIKAQDQKESLTYTYDPLNPTPTKGGKTLHPDLEQGPFDISDIIEGRNDVLTFTTNNLEQNLVTKGKTKVKLFFSSDRLDTDVVLKLTDVYPDGRSIMLDESFLRLRFRNGFSANDESLLVPGDIYEIELDFEDLAHTFLKGHKIRLVIASSNYIRLNRNLNNGLPLYPNNNLDTIYTPLVATNSIHMGAGQNSRIELPVVDVLSSTTNQKSAHNLMIYPNPTSNYIEIEGQEGERITITDINGRTLLTTELSDRLLRISLESWPSGAYWCNGNQFVVTR